ncbi:hypothetical protein FGO68_gene14873 [Halteria grandinella]|uniref:Uncharacterized protein n=1 Tax=Halteria grandinella TaxID=5974 RepID=A0A8J8NRM5_HALGN|nr:hypothetical protein FGO68_gene14873 [Halteria grandinella]
MSSQISLQSYCIDLAEECLQSGPQLAVILNEEDNDSPISGRHRKARDISDIIDPFRSDVKMWQCDLECNNPAYFHSKTQFYSPSASTSQPNLNQINIQENSQLQLDICRCPSFGEGFANFSPRSFFEDTTVHNILNRERFDNQSLNIFPESQFECDSDGIILNSNNQDYLSFEPGSPKRFQQQLAVFPEQNCLSSSYLDMRPTAQTNADSYNTLNENNQLIEVGARQININRIQTPFTIPPLTQPVIQFNKKGRPPKIRSLSKLPEPMLLRGIFRKILRLFGDSKVDSQRGKLQRIEVEGQMFQVAFAEVMGLDKAGYKEFAQRFKNIPCGKIGKQKPSFEWEECSIIWDACYRTGTVTIQAFFENDLLRLIFETAYPYLCIANHEANILRSHSNASKDLTPNQISKHKEIKQMGYLNTLQVLCQKYREIVPKIVEEQ